MAKKVVLVVVALLAIAAVFIAVLLVPQVDRRVAALVERYGGAATGTEVDVSGVTIGLTERRGTIDRLTIGNPEAFETDYAVRIEDAQVALDVGSLAREVPIVTELLLNDVHINAEQRANATNLTEIQEFMATSAGQPETGAAEGRIIVQRFRATNARLTITSDLLSRPETVDLEDVVVNDIGDTRGVTYSEAAAAILDPVIDAAVAAVRGRLRDTARDAAREEVEEDVEGLEQDAEERLRELLER